MKLLDIFLYKKYAMCHQSDGVDFIICSTNDLFLTCFAKLPLTAPLLSGTSLADQEDSLTGKPRCFFVRMNRGLRLLLFNFSDSQKWGAW